MYMNVVHYNRCKMSTPIYELEKCEMDLPLTVSFLACSCIMCGVWTIQSSRATCRELKNWIGQCTSRRAVIGKCLETLDGVFAPRLCESILFFTDRRSHSLHSDLEAHTSHTSKQLIHRIDHCGNLRSDELGNHRAWLGAWMLWKRSGV